MRIADPRPAPAPPSNPAGESPHIWVDDPQNFSGDHIQPIHHSFHTHALLQMPALARLAAALVPTGQCRFLQAGGAMDSEFAHKPRHPQGLEVDEVFRRIEAPGSWVALYNIETVAEYRALLAQVMACFAPLVQQQQPGIFNVGGFIFISAPPSVTPFHIDRENNFWMQIHGRKTLHVWDHRDRQLVPAPVVDNFIVYAGQEGVRLAPGHLSRSQVFDVGPGQGAYFPSTSPHSTRTERSWVTPGQAVSVSIGVVFYSATTRRRARVHACNVMLRRLGWQPAQPGQSTWVDAAKAALGWAYIAGKRRLRGYLPQVGL